jgi:hypothetical protein
MNVFDALKFLSVLLGSVVGLLFISALAVFSTVFYALIVIMKLGSNVVQVAGGRTSG